MQAPWYDITSMHKLSFKESYIFLKKVPAHLDNYEQNRQPPEPQLLDYVLQNSQKGSPADVIRAIDEFCRRTWMMNLGDLKA